MKNMMIVLGVMLATTAAHSAVVKCKDSSGDVRISFKCDTSVSDYVPACLTEVKVDGEKVQFNVGPFFDNGPVINAKNSAGESYSAQLQFGLFKALAGYKTDAVVQDVEMTLRCR